MRLHVSVQILSVRQLPGAHGTRKYGLVESVHGLHVARQVLGALIIISFN